MKEIKLLYIFLVLTMIVNVSCNRSDKYHKLVERQLATGVKKDTLLMNLRFGMNKREFFAHCWNLHKQGRVSEGTNNTTVHYNFKENGKEYDVNFYPKFHEGKIVELPVEYNYTAFAPWNAKYSLDSLFHEVNDIYKKDYGSDYIEIRPKDRDKGSAFVRVDGNRRITIFKNINTNSVEVIYYDLLSKKKDVFQK